MKAYSTLLCILLPISLFAQQQKTSLSKKWTNMLENAETYQMYKVIKKTELQDFEKSMSDTIIVYQKELKAEKAAAIQQAKEMVELKTNLTNVNTSLANITGEKDTISFLGISTNKYAYLSVLCFIIIGCIVLIAVLLLMYKRSQMIAIQKVESCKKAEQEYIEYKQTKFEMEKKLKREMQTLLNELEELKRR